MKLHAERLLKIPEIVQIGTIVEDADLKLEEQQTGILVS